MAQSAAPSPGAIPSRDLARAFREAFRCHPAGVAVITADPGGQPVAMTVSSLISVSADPPSVGFSLSAQARSSAAVLAAESLVIHLLRYDDLELAQLGARPGADRFGPGQPWARLPGGAPRYLQVATWFRARISASLAVAGAHLVVAELLEGAAAPSPMPERDTLIYLDRRWHRLHGPEQGPA